MGAAGLMATPRLGWADVADPNRRIRPGDPAWPDERAWSRLDRAVGGRLIEPKPLLDSCLRDGQSQACKATLKELANPFFIGDEVSGTQVSGWYKAWTPAASARAVAARGPADVQAAVNFARVHNLRLVVKGGGHSYQGTSNAPDSLLVWTRPMRDVTVHDQFTPKGGRGSFPAVSVGAGAVWLDVYDAVTTRAGRYVQGGGCTTVGVAGHVQSGGFGSCSKGFGTAAGSLLEAEVVTADGAIRVVNHYQDPELFWALKGGGGGSFGVVTRLTLLTHALPQVFGGVSGRLKAKTAEGYRALVARFLTFYADRLSSHPWGEQVGFHPGNLLTVSMLTHGLDETRIREIWAPFVEWTLDPAHEIEIERAIEPWSTSGRGFWDVAGMRAAKSRSMRYDDRPDVRANQGWWAGDQEQVGAFLHGYDSLWLPIGLLDRSGREALIDAVVEGARAAPLQFHFNKGLAGAPPEALSRSSDTATNPSVLQAFALLIVANGGLPMYPGVPWRGPDASVPSRDADAVGQAMKPFHAIAPNAGSYISESNYFNERWSQAFWGGNYPRLQRVKRHYDPGGLFFTHHGVSSEGWSQDGFRRLT